MHKNRTNTAFRGARCEYGQTNKKTVVALPVLLVFLGIFTRWVSGSPIPTLHFVGARYLVPPIWLLVLLFCIFYLLSGVALGMVLGNRLCSCGDKKYQGAMWHVISLALGYVWYPLFFCARLFLVSAVACAVCLFSAICATFCYVRVSKTAFFLSLLADVYLIYLTLLNLQIFFAI